MLDYYDEIWYKFSMIKNKEILQNRLTKEISHKTLKREEKQ